MLVEDAGNDAHGSRPVLDKHLDGIGKRLQIIDVRDLDMIFLIRNIILLLGARFLVIVFVHERNGNFLILLERVQFVKRGLILRNRYRGIQRVQAQVPEGWVIGVPLRRLYKFFPFFAFVPLLFPRGHALVNGLVDLGSFILVVRKGLHFQNGFFVVGARQRSKQHLACLLHDTVQTRVLVQGTVPFIHLYVALYYFLYFLFPLLFRDDFSLLNGLVQRFPFLGIRNRRLAALECFESTWAFPLDAVYLCL